MLNRILVISCCLFFSAFASSNPTMPLSEMIVVHDDRFYDFVRNDSLVEVLASGLGWAEGPVWSNTLGSLLFSDVASDKIYRWDVSRGLRDYLFPSGHPPDSSSTAWRGSNGLAIDQNDSLILAQQSHRKISSMLKPLTNPAPKFATLANRFQDSSLNSPNDLVVDCSGNIFFTDPPYGLAGFEKSPDIELDFFGVFRLSRQGKLIPIFKSLKKPNGIALSMDQSKLYVSNSGTADPKIIVINLDEEMNPIGYRLFFDARKLVPDGPGSTDGMAVHASDFVFTSIPNGVGVLSPEGDLLGKIKLGQVTNVTFDTEFAHLYITTPQKLLRLKLEGVTDNMLNQPSLK